MLRDKPMPGRVFGYEASRMPGIFAQSVYPPVELEPHS
jgi:hypothetical protein